MKTVTVLSIGVVGIENGNTQYDWGIYDDFWLNKIVFSMKLFKVIIRNRVERLVVIGEAHFDPVLI